MLAAILEFLKKAVFLVGTVTQKSSFPKQLSPEEENKLIDALTAGDADARDRLIEHNLRLVAHIAKKYANSGRNADDLISIGTIGLIKAVNTYDRDKCRSIAGYASRCIENEILMLIRSEKKHASEISLEEPIGSDRDGNEITLSDILASDDEPIVDEILARSSGMELRRAVDSLLTEQENNVIKLRYGLNNERHLAQREVGKMLGISRSYVSRIEKRALQKLRACIKP